MEAQASEYQGIRPFSATEQVGTQNKSFIVSPGTKLKPKTQGKNSTSGRHFPPYKRNSGKKLNNSQKLLKTEKNHGVPLFMPFLLANISKFYQFHIIFAKSIESF